MHNTLKNKFNDPEKESIISCKREQKNYIQKLLPCKRNGTLLKVQKEKGGLNLLAGKKLNEFKSRFWVFRRLGFHTGPTEANFFLMEPFLRRPVVLMTRADAQQRISKIVTS
jgi:hypothetical protein